MEDLRLTNRRELQLDAISTLLIVSISIVVALLLFFLSSAGVQLPAAIPLANYLPRILLGAFVLLVVVYLWDQRARLRRTTNAAIERAEQAQAELDSTSRYLAFSHQAASRLGTEGVHDGMLLVLQDASVLFQADAAAVLGEDEEHVFIAEDVPADEAERALTHAAMVATARNKAMYIESLGTEEGQAMVVPLRVQGDLRYALALWKRSEAFQPDQLDALGLMGRMVELAIEREESVTEGQQQLEGTLRVMQYLVADKRPDYSRHVLAVANLAAAIGWKLGLPPQTRKDLRLAGLVHDAGMMALRHELAEAGRPLTAEESVVVRQHPSVGAEIAKAANLDSMVQDAVAGHHERMDGSGYPLGLGGPDIPIEASIIAVCEVYDSMTHRSYHSAEQPAEDAIAELTAGAGRLYNGQVVSALWEIVGEHEAAELTPADEPVATLRA